MSMRFLSAAVAAGALFAMPVWAQTAAPPQAQDSYFRAAQSDLQARLRQQPNTKRAKNVILFVGDGMGVNTLTAARIFQGQLMGHDGESFQTAMDGLPYAGLVKTYSHDAQVSDSAPTATALMAGVKTRNDLLGVDQTVPVGDCAAVKGHEVQSIFAQAEAAGLSTGIVSTARITHATPAAAFAHTPDRDWENDTQVPAAAQAAGCKDIARQLIEWPAGDGFEVILGGGRAQFLPKTLADPEDKDAKGLRGDKRDLIAEWRKRNKSGAYVWNKAQFDAVDPGKTAKLLGLFERDHLEFEAQRETDAGGEPALAELTAKAIQMLSKSEKGFVLMVEAGRIDHAHHGGDARLALTDTVALDQAVRAAASMTNPEETLIIVTADHSHNLSIVGYPRRNNSILDVVVGVDGRVAKGLDGKAMTTLAYANGPGAPVNEPRRDPAQEQTRALDYRQAALVPLRAASHGGEDVAVRASGPHAHLLTGTLEQHLIYHVMAHALALNEPR